MEEQDKSQADSTEAASTARMSASLRMLGLVPGVIVGMLVGVWLDNTLLGIVLGVVIAVGATALIDRVAKRPQA